LGLITMLCAARIASASVSHRRVEPSISVNKTSQPPTAAPPRTPAQDVIRWPLRRGQPRLTFKTLITCESETRYARCSVSDSVAESQSEWRVGGGSAKKLRRVDSPVRPPCRCLRFT
jgi:hypothetical protein